MASSASSNSHMDGEITPAIGPTACRSWQGAERDARPAFEFLDRLGLVGGQPLENHRADQRAAQRAGGPANSIGGPAWQNSPGRSPSASPAGRTSIEHAHERPACVPPPVRWPPTVGGRPARRAAAAGTVDVAGIADRGPEVDGEHVDRLRPQRIGEQVDAGADDLGVGPAEQVGGRGSVARLWCRASRPAGVEDVGRTFAARLLPAIAIEPGSPSGDRPSPASSAGAFAGVLRPVPFLRWNAAVTGRPAAASHRPAPRPRPPSSANTRTRPAATSAAAWRCRSCGSPAVPHNATTTDNVRAIAGGGVDRCAMAGANRPAGSGSAAMAEHDIEQQHGDVGVGCLLGEQLQPQRRVDHRVRPASGELVVPEVDHDVTQPRQHRPPVSGGGRRRANSGRSGMFERMSPSTAPATTMASSASVPPEYSPRSAPVRWLRAPRRCGDAS